MVCYTCGEEGHISRNCTKYFQTNQSRGPPPPPRAGPPSRGPNSQFRPGGPPRATGHYGATYADEEYKDNRIERRQEEPSQESYPTNDEREAHNEQSNDAPEPESAYCSRQFERAYKGSSNKTDFTAEVVLRKDGFCQSATAIIDTGCSVSLIDEKSFRGLTPMHQDVTRSRVSIHGLEESCPLESLGTVKMTTGFTTKDGIEREAQGQYEIVDSSFRADVLIGLPMLQEIGANLNMRTMCLEFPDNGLIDLASLPPDEDDDSWDFGACYAARIDDADDDEEEEMGEQQGVIGTRYEDLVTKECPHLFAEKVSELPEAIGVNHCIELNPGSTPKKGKPYRMSRTEQKELSRQVQELTEAGIVRPSYSPYGSPAFLRKKKGGTYRMVVDYRAVNASTKIDAYPLPNIGELLRGMQGSKVFSTLDLKSGFYQIPMDGESIYKTAFVTHEGLYEFTRMPFGLTNAPATFQRQMNRILSDLPFCVIYVDDILIFSANEEEHLAHLRAVFERIERANMAMNLAKCHFGMTSIHFLGHVVNQEGVGVDPAKVEAINKIKDPTDKTGIRQFLGLTGYYRCFIPLYSIMALPLTNLTKKKNPWIWTPECSQAVKDLKSALTEAPVLRHPDWTKPFTLYTDASNTCVSGILSQKTEDDKEYVIEYYSSKLNAAELNYSITEKECLAVVKSIRRFRYYLHGPTTFHVVTDHSALVWLQTKTDLAGRLARWAMELQAYKFEITHRPGKSNNNADALTRLETEDETKEKCLFIKLAPELQCYPGGPTADIYDQPVLLQYVTTKDFPVGSTDAMKKHAQKQARHYEMRGDEIWVNERFQVPPKDQREEMVLNAHRMGHQGREATLNRLKQMEVYWPGITGAVEFATQNCRVCLSTERSTGTTVRATPGTIKVTDPFEVVGLDLVGPLTTTPDGHRYILVIVDHLTKHCETYPLANKEAPTVARAYVDYILRYARPQRILTDCGTEFVNQIMKSVNDIMQIEHSTTAPYNPQCNGLTERTNRTIIGILRKTTMDQGKEEHWDHKLPYVTHLYNTKPTATGYSPHYLLFGRRAQAVGISRVIKWTQGTVETPDVERRKKDLDAMYDTVYPAVAVRSDEVKDKRVETNSTGEATEVPNGSYVYVKINVPGGKLNVKYHGPCRVVGRTLHGLYRLQNMVGKAVNVTVRGDRLKLVTSLQANMEDKNSVTPNYEVEEIRGDKIVKGKTHYLIKWQGYDERENSWEPDDHLACMELLEEYWKEKALGAEPE